MRLTGNFSIDVDILSDVDGGETSLANLSPESARQVR